MVLISKIHVLTTRENSFHREDSPVFNPPNSSCESASLRYMLTHSVNSYSYVVDWQLSKRDQILTNDSLGQIINE